MFTQCPSCQTIFEVSAEHLKAANGDVRCGQCLSIFSALENLSEEVPVHQNAAKGTSAESQVDVESEDIPEEIFQPDESQAEEIIEEVTYKPAEVPEEPEETDTVDIAAVSAEATNPEIDTYIEAGDETNIDTNIDTNVETKDEASIITPEEDEELAEFFSDVADDASDDAISDTPQTPANSIYTRISASRARDLTGGFYYGANEAIIEKILQEEDPDLSEFTLKPDEHGAAASEPIETPIIEESNSTESLITNVPSLIMDDLEADKAAQLKPPNTPWVIGSILLMLVFILQAIYFSRDDLAKNPTWRPMLTSACDMLGCTVAVPYDIKLIEIIGRDVRSHPTAKKALIAGTTMINNAKFAQPYPLLTLTFSDIRGTKLAQRRFTPAEYLRSGADIKAGMAPEVPIQVELELVDPGKAAVNFEFRAELDPRIKNPHT